MRLSVWVIVRIVLFLLAFTLIGIGLKQIAIQGELREQASPDRQQTFRELINPVASLSGTSPATSAGFLVPTPVVNPVPSIIIGEKAFHVPILLYHYVSRNENTKDTVRTGLSTPPEVFDAQLALLSQHGFTTISMDELAAAFYGTAVLPKKPIILTFDDGYEDFYTNAAPLLKKYNMKGMSFIPTGLMGGGNYMTWREIEELSRTPNVVFGAHSVHHYVLPKMADDVLKSEVLESKEVLERHVGYPVNWFCYPYGSFDGRVVNAVKKAGFIGSIATLTGVWQYQSRFFYIPRLRTGIRTGEEFLSLIQ